MAMSLLRPSPATASNITCHSQMDSSYKTDTCHMAEGSHVTYVDRNKQITDPGVLTGTPIYGRVLCLVKVLVAISE